jgi:hypothetical protein
MIEWYFTSNIVLDTMMDTFNKVKSVSGSVLELVYKMDSKSIASQRSGSSLLTPTIL